MSNDEIDGASRGIKVIIKAGKGYEEPWITFGGQPNEVRADILAVFGIDPETAKGWTTSDVVQNASNVFRGIGSAASVLGATVVKTEKAKPAEQQPAGEDAWAGVEQTPAQPEQPAADPIITAIGQAEDLKELQGIYAKHNDAFKARQDVRDAFAAARQRLGL